MNINAKKFIPRMPYTQYDMVIYHGHCPDGVAGAWCYWRINKNAEFIAATYGSAAPDIYNKKVLFIDFIYPVDIMEYIAEHAKYVRVLDHHKSSYYITNMKRISSVIDMNRSGAQLAWDEFNPGQPRPICIEYIADKDLYKYELDNSRAINKAMLSMGFLNDIESFNKVLNHRISEIIDIGNVLINDDIKTCEKIANMHTQCIYDKYRVCVVNCPLWMLSDVAVLLYDICDFVACPSYNFIHKSWNISFRSRDIDLLPIIKNISVNGGGHSHACGCRYVGNIDDIFTAKLFKSIQ